MKALVYLFAVLLFAKMSWAQDESIEVVEVPEEISEMPAVESGDDGGLPHFTKWLVKGCEEGRAKACYRMGRVLESYSRGQRSVKYFQAGCELGDQSSCDKAPALTPPVSDELPDTMIAEEAPAQEVPERSIASGQETIPEEQLPNENQESLPPPPPPVAPPVD